MPKIFSSIAWKGVAMVLLPLTLQLLFILLFLNLIFQTLSDLKAEFKSRLLINDAVLFSRASTAETSSLVGYALSGEKQYVEQYAKAKNSANENLSLLKKEASPQQQAILSEIESIYGRLSKERRSLLLPQQMDKPADLLDAPYFKRTQQLSWQLKDAVEVFINAETPNILHKNVKFVLLFGVLSGILASVIVAFFFSKEIAERINLLINNTRRFSSGKTLLPTLPGNDEIATYDRAFRDMAIEIESAKKYREQLVSVVSHEIRAPLTSAGATLSVLLAGIHGQANESTQTHLAQAEEEVANTIEMVSDLIDIDRLKSGKYPCKFKNIELNNLVHEVVCSWKEERFFPSITTESSESNIMVNSDASLLKRLLTRLIENCTLPSGTVSIKVNISKENDEIVLSVTGTRENATEKFVDNAESRLAICRAIAEVHNARLEIDKSNEISISKFRLRNCEASNPGSSSLTSGS